MEQSNLLTSEISYLKQEIAVKKISLFFTSVVTILLLASIAIFCYMTDRPYLEKLIGLLSIFIIPATIVSVIQFNRLNRDIKNEIKKTFVTDNYEVKDTQDSVKIKILSPVQLNFTILKDQLVKAIPENEKLLIAFSPSSKTVLQISADTENLIKQTDGKETASL